MLSVPAFYPLVMTLRYYNYHNIFLWVNMGINNSYQIPDNRWGNNGYRGEDTIPLCLSAPNKNTNPGTPADVTVITL